MAYRRRQAAARSSTFEVIASSNDDGLSSPTPSLAAQAIRASSAGRSSSLASAYGEQAIARGRFDRDSVIIDQPATARSSDEGTKSEGIWGALTRKARSILHEEDGTNETSSWHHHQQNLSIPHREDHQRFQSPDGVQKHVGMLKSSLNYIGNALEEGLNRVEHRTTDIIQETKKLNITRKSDGGSQTQVNTSSPVSPQPRATDYETQLKASRNVANAMAAKAKLLLRELKTVKADLAFAKERCAQLEEENKVLRENREKGDHHDDDDLVRLQLETLLAEKARLAQENSIYARENRFLREIVEYHQLTMQDVVYVDEGIEEVSEVYPSMQVSSSPQSEEPSSLPVPVPPPSMALGSD